MSGETEKEKSRKRRYKKEKLSKEKKTAVFIVTGLILVTVIFALICFFNHSSNDTKSVISDSAETQTNPSDDNTEASTENDTIDSFEEPEETTEEPADSGKAEYDFSSPVPQCDPVDDEYFSDAVFLGDSRTEGFALFSGLTTMTTYASRGLNVSTVFTDASIDLNGTMVTAIDALKSTSFGKLYIMFGLNEAGWSSTDYFIEEYGRIIDEARAVNPDAVIYIQSVLPVTKSFSDSSDTFNKPRIDEYNSLLMKLAQDKQAYYVNCAEAVADSEGYLPEGSATDGIHFGVPQAQAWLEYLKTHTVSNSQK